MAIGGAAAAAWHAVVEIVTALPKFIRILCRRIHAALRRHRDRPDPGLPCLPIPSGVWLRPDAYLYSQRLLMGLGMAVTWDNPDVTITDAGSSVVGSHDLLPSTQYRVTAMIHNKSADAPAPGLPVVFTLLSFGAGGPPRQLIGTDTINLPVRAAPGEPAAASVLWTTPPTPDHYCIEIDCSWPDDAFPIDNVGQHNTVVRRVACEQRFLVDIPIWHALRELRGEAERRELVVTLDGYQLPGRPLLHREGEAEEVFAERIKEANLARRHPADEAWRPTLSSHRVEVGHDGASVTFEATAPATAEPGTQARFNVSVSDPQDGRVIGGVTVIAEVI